MEYEKRELEKLDQKQNLQIIKDLEEANKELLDLL